MIQQHQPVQTYRTCIPNAQQVYLVGDFNNWSTTATPLSQVADETWEVSLQPGLDLARLCLFVWHRGRSYGRVMRLPRLDQPQAGDAI